MLDSWDGKQEDGSGFRIHSMEESRVNSERGYACEKKELRPQIYGHSLRSWKARPLVKEPQGSELALIRKSISTVDMPACPAGWDLS